MFGNEELKYLADMADRFLKESAHNMRVILEISVDKKLNLMLEALQAQQEQIKTLASNSRVDALEEEIIMLRSVVKKHTREIEELKHA